MAHERTTYREALGAALADAMAEDNSVLVVGEEVGKYGGAYGVTRGMLDRFGPERIVDTPISEPGIVGCGVGMAMAGLRPVVELMYIDFLALTMDQFGNQAAKIRYMFGGQIGVPMVLRTQGGTGRSGAAQHSQSLEAWCAHIPGLRVAVPATISDAYHLLRAAIDDPDPVLFAEHKGLYVAEGDLDRSRPDAPWGKAAVRRSGSDVTLVAHSKAVHTVLAAADALAGQGIEAEVIDLRTLNPLDEETVFESVRKTGRAAAVNEAPLSFGPGAEIAARISEACFDYLDDPVIRICGEDVPIPVAPDLERASVPDAERVVAAVCQLAQTRP